MPPRMYLPVNEAARKHGEKIRRARLALCMSQREVGELFGIDQSTVSQLEAGYYNILKAWPKHKLLNEKMRIWAEMNKNGKPRVKYLEPFVSGRSKFWRKYEEEKKKKEQK